MNNAAVDSDIEHNCQQTEIDFSKRLLQLCRLALLCQKNAALQGPATQQTCSFSQRNTACCEKTAAHIRYRNY